MLFMQQLCVWLRPEAAAWPLGSSAEAEQCAGAQHLPGRRQYTVLLSLACRGFLLLLISFLRFALKDFLWGHFSEQLFL